jgi:two-component system nitrogen regulation sensor histidine kinase NtrY
MKNFRLNLIIRIIFIAVSIILFFFLYYNTNLVASLIIISLLIILQVILLIKYVDATNKELARFFQSINYSDFSQTFSTKSLGSSFEELNRAFNEVILRFQKTRSEKEEHYRYLQTVIQHVGVGLISFNQNGNIEFINNAAKKILKISSLHNIEQLNSVSKDLGTSLFKVKNGEKTTIKIVDENELIQLMVNAIEFKLRDQIFTLVSLQNIQSELEEKEMDAWQKLIRVLTHEIMNSVTPISSLAGTVNNILSTNGNKENIPREEIADIKSAINTIQKRSEGLLHFVDDYRSLFNSIENLMGKEIRDKKINLSVSIEPESLELTADPEMVEQVIINLIINAIYAVSNSPNPEIKLSANIDERGKVVIKITDNGIGIQESDQEKIFIPFFSTKKDGSGIGLSLSRQIIRAHGGTIRAHSLPGEGTTFILRF